MISKDIYLDIFLNLPGLVKKIREFYSQLIANSQELSAQFIVVRVS